VQRALAQALKRPAAQEHHPHFFLAAVDVLERRDRARIVEVRSDQQQVARPLVARAA
jgi:hypothetical protein